ncbi:MAG TPA: serine/threonine-protein kinase, partial [Gemmatimonadales bacterium]|nr:serine/threonine-protein kinase [Gemmatimonadales bacterium]
MSQELRRSLQDALGSAYTLERELSGGMSRVFVATETALARRVVLKVFPPELSAGLRIDRFRREIQLVARLQRHGELPVAVALRWLAQVARALAYAHRHGIVHRDIKPENILLSGDEAQVADFGIAKALSDSAGASGITSAGLAIGTPAYMAPEQALAEPTVDHRADLYALGVVAYEALAGQPPFAARTSAQWLAAHANERPIPLRERRPGVPGAVAELVMRLLEKRPADRPQSADEVAQVLETAAQTGADSIAVSPVTEMRSSHRGRWITAGAVGGVALIALVASFSRHGKPVPVDRQVVAVAPFRVSGADSSLGYLHEGLVDLLAAKLSGTAGLRPADPRTLAGG